jgi:peptidoglycan/xylan/chitin deacetylase (PgdA/CDA1 family)
MVGAREENKPDRVVSVSVDLDAVACYHGIHGLPDPPPDGARFAILRRCLPRFAELFARHGVRATFFVVGADLDEDPEGRALLAALARAGHELGNHTHTHRYDFVRLGPSGIAEEIDRAHAAIAACAGAPPLGFRAPGYEISAAVVEALAARGYRYDSSILPSPPYYGAKALVMGAMRIAGRRSHSILGNVRAPFSPRAPYPLSRAGSPYRAGHAAAALVELPITVTPLARLHVIGTTLVLAPAWLRRRLVGRALAGPFFNLELHGIDLADAEADRLPPALVARQPDLRRPLARKLAALEATLVEARAAGARFATLAEAAGAFAPAG